MNDPAATFVKFLKHLLWIVLFVLIAIGIYLSFSRGAKAQSGAIEAWNQSVTWGGAITTSTPVRSDVLRNVDQSSHLVYVCSSGTVTASQEVLQGSFDGSNWFPVSNTVHPQAGNCSFVSAGGYFPDVALFVSTVAGGSISASYSATHTTLPLTLAAAPGDPCQNSTLVKSSTLVAAGGVGTTPIVGASSAPGTVLYVCGYTLTVTGTTPTIQWSFGTTCTSSLTNLSGAFAPSSGVPLTTPGNWTQFTIPAGNALCLALGGTSPNAEGYLNYIQQ